MASSGSPAGQPRSLTIRVRRTMAVSASVVALPLTLAACGLLGGGGADKDPVVIPGQAVEATNSASSSSSASLESMAPATDSAASPVQVTVTAQGAEAPPGETVTRTGVVVQKETQYATRTRVARSTVLRTLRPVTATRTPPVDTVTETKTSIRTKKVTRLGEPSTKTIGNQPGDPNPAGN